MTGMAEDTVLTDIQRRILESGVEAIVAGPCKYGKWKEFRALLGQWLVQQKCPKEWLEINYEIVMDCYIQSREAKNAPGGAVQTSSGGTSSSYPSPDSSAVDGSVQAADCESGSSAHQVTGEETPVFEPDVQASFLRIENGSGTGCGIATMNRCKGPHSFINEKTVEAQLLFRNKHNRVRVRWFGSSEHGTGASHLTWCRVMPKHIEIDIAFGNNYLSGTDWCCSICREEGEKSIGPRRPGMDPGIPDGPSTGGVGEEEEEKEDWEHLEIQARQTQIAARLNVESAIVLEERFRMSKRKAADPALAYVLDSSPFLKKVRTKQSRIQSASPT